MKTPLFATSLFFTLLSFSFLQINATDTLKVVKVFELDANVSGNVYNFYIDSVGTTQGQDTFCFQVGEEGSDTTKLIKTDFEGKALEILDNPYSRFTVFNGDTLFCRDSVVINATTGESLCKVDYRIIGIPMITSSVSNVFVFIPNDKRYYQYIINQTTHQIVYQTYHHELSGLCCGKGFLFVIDYGELKYCLEDGSKLNEAVIPISNPRGIAEYKGSLYVYSFDDRSVYRLDMPEIVTSVRCNPAEPTQTIYYNLSGVKTDKPEGLTIVVTRYSDGTVRAEKKLF